MKKRKKEADRKEEWTSKMKLAYRIIVNGFW